MRSMVEGARRSDGGPSGRRAGPLSRLCRQLPRERGSIHPADPKVRETRALPPSTGGFTPIPMVAHTCDLPVSRKRGTRPAFGCRARPVGR